MLLQAAVDALKPVLEDSAILKIGHNLKFDWQVLAQHGIRITRETHAASLC